MSGTTPFRIEFSQSVPDIPDGDYTQDCIDAGTTFSLEGKGFRADNVPVESFVVKDGTLRVEGTVWADLGS